MDEPHLSCTNNSKEYVCVCFHDLHLVRAPPKLLLVEIFKRNVNHQVKLS